MKNMIFGLITGGTVILFAVLFLTLLHKNVRREELEQSLAEAMQVTMQAWDEEKRESVERTRVHDEIVPDEEAAGLCDREALADYLLQTLGMQLESDSDVTVKVLAADADRGLLSAEVTEEFTYPGGQRGNVSVKRTMIADREETAEKEMHTVRFFCSKADMESGANIYKRFQIQHGDRLIQPSEPKGESDGRSFKEWRDSSDYLSDFSQMVEEDLTYYAVFE